MLKSAKQVAPRHVTMQHSRYEPRYSLLLANDANLGDLIIIYELEESNTMLCGQWPIMVNDILIIIFVYPLVIFFS